MAPEKEIVFRPGMEPVSAELHQRGFSRMYRKGGRYGPYWFAYDDVTKESPWRPIDGAFTRYGDVLPLHGRAVQRSGRDRLGAGDREARGDTRALVDRAGLAQVAGEPGQHLQQVVPDLGDDLRLLA